MQYYDKVLLSYSSDSAWLVSDQQDNKHYDVDGGISLNAEALEPDLL